LWIESKGTQREPEKRADSQFDTAAFWVTDADNALLHSQFGSAALSYVFGSLLVFAVIMGITGLSSRRLRFEGAVAWVAGALSGAFGGLVGNHGGIRLGRHAVNAGLQRVICGNGDCDC